MKKHETQTLRLPVVTSVNAGRGVPDDTEDWDIVAYRDVDMPVGCDMSARYFLTEVDGDSLKHKHIVPGDFLLCRVAAEYESGKIGIWQTPSGRTAKFAYFDDGDGCVVLHNDGDWRQQWDRRDIQLLGLVDKIERDTPAEWGI